MFEFKNCQPAVAAEDKVAAIESMHIEERVPVTPNV